MSSKRPHALASYGSKSISNADDDLVDVVITLDNGQSILVDRPNDKTCAIQALRAQEFGTVFCANAARVVGKTITSDDVAMWWPRAGRRVVHPTFGPLLVSACVQESWPPMFQACVIRDGDHTTGTSSSDVAAGDMVEFEVTDLFEPNTIDLSARILEHAEHTGDVDSDDDSDGSSHSDIIGYEEMETQRDAFAADPLLFSSVAFGTLLADASMPLSDVNWPLYNEVGRFLYKSDPDLAACLDLEGNTEETTTAELALAVNNSMFKLITFAGLPPTAIVPLNGTRAALFDMLTRMRDAVDRISKGTTIPEAPLEHSSASAARVFTERPPGRTRTPAAVFYLSMAPPARRRLPPAGQNWHVQCPRCGDASEQQSALEDGCCLSCNTAAACSIAADAPGRSDPSDAPRTTGATTSATSDRDTDTTTTAAAAETNTSGGNNGTPPAGVSSAATTDGRASPPAGTSETNQETAAPHEAGPWKTVSFRQRRPPATGKAGGKAPLHRHGSPRPPKRRGQPLVVSTGGISLGSGNFPPLPSAHEGRPTVRSAHSPSLFPRSRHARASLPSHHPSPHSDARKSRLPFPSQLAHSSSPGGSPQCALSSSSCRARSVRSCPRAHLPPPSRHRRQAGAACQPLQPPLPRRAPPPPLASPRPPRSPHPRPAPVAALPPPGRHCRCRLPASPPAAPPPAPLRQHRLPSRRPP